MAAYELTHNGRTGVRKGIIFETDGQPNAAVGERRPTPAGQQLPRTWRRAADAAQGRRDRDLHHRVRPRRHEQPRLPGHLRNVEGQDRLGAPLRGCHRGRLGRTTTAAPPHVEHRRRPLLLHPEDPAPRRTCRPSSRRRQRSSPRAATTWSSSTRTRSSTRSLRRVARRRAAPRSRSRACTSRARPSVKFGGTNAPPSPSPATRRSPRRLRPGDRELDGRHRGDDGGGSSPIVSTDQLTYSDP